MSMKYKSTINYHFTHFPNSINEPSHKVLNKLREAQMKHIPVSLPHPAVISISHKRQHRVSNRYALCIRVGGLCIVNVRPMLHA